jgi:hypothetical protein
MHCSWHRGVLVVLGIVFVAGAGSAAQQGVAAPGALLTEQFTHQGQLKRSGLPVNSTCDMQFALWDDLAAGTQIGSVSAVAAVAVANGLYTVVVNQSGEFGAGAFNGQERYLAVSVQCAGDPGFTLLAPRHRLSPTPYAAYALNSHQLDGLEATAFSPLSHLHSAAAITSGTLSTNVFSAYSDLGVEGRIGSTIGTVAEGNHVHDDRYVNVGGDTMSGDLTLPRVIYSSPRLHVTSLSSEAFFPTSNVDYYNGGGQGGASKPAGTSGVLAASVQLPDGATVTKFRVYYYDNSPNEDLDVSLDCQMMMVGAYSTLASVTTSGASNAYAYLETTSISTPIIDNVNNGYLVWVWPTTTWNDFNLRIKGVSIYYTLAEAR